MPSRYIVQLENREPSPDKLARELAEFDISLDMEYGLVPINAVGNQLVGRVVATEDAIRRAEESLQVSFFPDFEISV